MNSSGEFRGKSGRIVYSTDAGRHCPACGKPMAKCDCRTEKTPPGDGIVRLQRQTKSRKGKPVIVISGLTVPPEQLKQIAKRLKARCAVGGTVEDGNIIIQGDQRTLIKAELETLGYNVK